MSPAPASASLGVMFAGGGSGGHIYPNIAIFEQVRALDPGAVAEFLVSRRQIDASILAAEGHAFTALDAQPLIFRPRALLRLAWTWGRAVRSARERICAMRSHCDRVLVIATGGFVSAPVANAARAERVPFVLVNLDAAPGKANRFAARHATARLTAAEGSAPPHWERIRPIVRARAVASSDPAKCRAALNLAPDKQTLLVTGASQGARSINQFMQAFAARHSESLAGWQILHQTGADADPSIESTYASAGISARVVPFIDAIGDAWGAADLAVSRAGAGSVAEAWANATPTLFLPYPHHRDEHQRLNAAPVIEAGAGVLCTDHVDIDRNLEHAGQRLIELLLSADDRRQLLEAFSRLGPADGAKRVAQVALGLCQP